jgi:phosphoribosyl 1,2-cyclic phosphate phosphodiesterase
MRDFHYIFSPESYPGIPVIDLIKYHNVPFTVGPFDIIPVKVLHYKLPVFGFRIQNFCYITDANYISNDEKKKLKNLDVLVLNALRHEKHLSHFTLSEALELIDELKPKKAYLTHISHQLGLHTDVSKLLPDNVELAYDGLKLEMH